MSAAVMDTDYREASRSLVVSGVPDVLPVSRMVDKLTIHFQSYRRSRGGDVEEVRYPTNMDGVAFVIFDQAADADRAAAKKRHVMTDDEFPADYRLTVFPFTRDVFFYVPSATVDLSLFGEDQTSLIRSLRSAHRSLRFEPEPELMKATIEGPFAAVRALRQDLICRASRLKLTTQTAAAKPKETPNPSVISPVGSSKAKPGPGSSNCLSPPLQTTGEAPQSHARTQNVTTRRKVFKKQEQTDYQTEASSKPEEISAKHPGGDASEERSRLDRISAAQIRETDYVTGSDHSSSAPNLQPRPRDVTELQDQDDMSFWVDSYTLRYMEKFDRRRLDRCLRGPYVKREGAELTRITLTDRKTSAGVRKSLEDLVQDWQQLLRVHQIDFVQKEKQKLIKICDDVNLLFTNVLYILEDSCVKIVGYSTSSHLFCEWVQRDLKAL
ncbi:uncharacterized protein LOC131963159 [Centropristis striata]|uniref:uncharacterized protein LOC131963159 n=1 Tax=Centropristis striata TaxID=184440 RepID=UPI0027DEC0BD|nr:uncharacterized protein LOC131963159 [Centropristis striata]